MSDDVRDSRTAKTAAPENAHWMIRPADARRQAVELKPTELTIEYRRTGGQDWQLWLTFVGPQVRKDASIGERLIVWSFKDGTKRLPPWVLSKIAEHWPEWA